MWPNDGAYRRHASAARNARVTLERARTCVLVHAGVHAYLRAHVQSHIHAMASHMVGTRKRSKHIESARDHVSGVRPEQPSMRTRQAPGSVNGEGRGRCIWSLRASVSAKRFTLCVDCPSKGSRFRGPRVRERYATCVRITYARVRAAKVLQYTMSIHVVSYNRDASSDLGCSRKHACIIIHIVPDERGPTTCISSCAAGNSRSSSFAGLAARRRTSQIAQSVYEATRVHGLFRT